MVEVIQKMPNPELDEICDAGVELVKQLVALMERRGISGERASEVIAVAAAGITLGSATPMSEFICAVEALTPMWRRDRRGEETGITFDPPHRRKDYVEPAVDPTRGN